MTPDVDYNHHTVNLADYGYSEWRPCMRSGNSVRIRRAVKPLLALDNAQFLLDLGISLSKQFRQVGEILLRSSPQK
jgi:hypothetical protein